MSSLDNDKALLDALRAIGVVVPDVPPIAVKAKTLLPVVERQYWLISNGAFYTFVDPREAPSEDEAIKIAREDATQPWYINDHLADAITVKKIGHNEYIDWLRRGVR